MEIVPLTDRVLVKPDHQETTAGGVIIPGNAKEKPQKGTIVAVGPGRTDYKMSCCIDDTVLYAKYAGSEIQENGQTLLIMRETDILAILR